MFFSAGFSFSFLCDSANLRPRIPKYTNLSRYWQLWDIRRTKDTQFNPLGLPVMTLPERLEQLEDVVSRLLRVRPQTRMYDQSARSMISFLLVFVISCSVRQVDTTEPHIVAIESAILQEDGLGYAAQPG